jgi:ubiquinone/menaquinone biosynthesis C-methylase UbiE
MITNECLPGIKFPNGEDTGQTRGKQGGAPVRLRNARVARSLDLSGMRVLDVGCGPGLYTLYMADSAKEVVGIDHQQDRIAVAGRTAQKLGCSNVHFKVADIRDADVLRELGSFDLVVAWGFLHRISDIFSALYNLAQITDAFSLEWMTPIFPFMRRASVAYHRTDVDELDTTNLVAAGQLSAEEAAGKKIGGKSGFWFPTPFAVESILRKFGFEEAHVLGYNEGLWAERRMVLWHLAQKAMHPSTVSYARVHMLVQRSSGSIKFKYKDLNDAQLPEWDVAGRNYLGATGSIR